MPDGLASSLDPSASERVLLVSADSHVGPRLEADLGPYCPQQHLDAFDDFAANPAVHATRARMLAAIGPNATGAGHYDPATRLAEMDAHGVVSEVDAVIGEQVPLGRRLFMVSPDEEV